MRPEAARLLDDEAARPYVCVIDACTERQAVEAGRAMYQAAGVCARFLEGTLAEAYDRECVLAAQAAREAAEARKQARRREGAR